MKTTFRTLALAALTATTLISTVAAPAQAGKKERAFLTGVLATVAVGALVMQANAQPRATTTPTYEDRDYRGDGYDRYTPVTRRDDRSQRYGGYERRISPRDTYRAPHRAPVYTAPAAQEPAIAAAFYDLTFEERRMVQQRLALQGYYGYGIDGMWGPGTERAVRAFARDRGVAYALNDPRDARKIYDALLLY